jgi:CHAT domain-containing protein
MFIAAALKLQEQTGDQKYAEAAFAAAEKSRSIALLDANRLSEVENNFSQEDRNRLYAFRARLTALENKKAALSLDSPEWNGAQQQYSSLHYAFQQFIDQDILTKYPTYYQLKYETAQTGVPEVQKALGTDQSLLLYFVGDSAISAFVVTSNTFTIKVIPLTFPLKTWVEQFRYYMDESHYKEGVDQFVQVASQLYDKLLSPLESLLKPKVIIAADGLLNYLPFEALIAQQPAIPSRFKEHEYFLKLHEVSYCFSATLMIKMARQEKQEQPPPSLMAFAPFYEGDSLRFVYNDYSSRGDTLDALPASGEETYRVSQLWKGKYYWGKSASKQYFMEAAQKTDILLLSTHGKSEDRMGDYSWLAFSKSDTAGYELLYANEIINLRLHSSLVFLSACETGMGKIRRGEGVISLARAFTYAGAKSVITTLWSVNDSGTGSLVIDFFLYLHQGKTQSEALQSAKLRQIQQGRHPYFWAGFVGLGDMEQKYL